MASHRIYSIFIRKQMCYSKQEMKKRAIDMEITVNGEHLVNVTGKLGRQKECGDPKSGYFQLISIYSQRSIGISAHMNLLWCKMNDITDIVWYR